MTDMTRHRLASADANHWHVDAATADLVRDTRPPRPLALAATPQNLVIDLARTAILVIDMQNDFCHPDGWLAGIGVDVAPARRPIAPLASVLPALRRAGVPVLWINWGNRADRLNLSPSLLHATRCPAMARGCWRRTAGRPPWSTSWRPSPAISGSTNIA
jgi:hypothetical protein